MTAAYRKIIHLPRPASGRIPMAVERRAKQFAPFAALKGFEDAVREKEIIYEPRRILSEEKKNELDMKLRMLKPGMEILVEFFTGNPSLPGFGRYHTVKGDVAFFDPSVGLRVGDTEIEIRDICEMSGDVFEILEMPC